jgi:tRNA A37 threonylcarbamoyltransferase TsaD
LLHSGDLDFSFAGLKTAVLTQAQKLGDQLDARKADLAASTEAAIVEVLLKKSLAALRQTGLSRLVVAGGDSSSFTMRALGAQALQCKASHFAQNAHFASLVSDDMHIHGKELLLKGGQVGAEDLYSLALNGFGH